MDICFATNNKGKLAEIRALLSGYRILSLTDIGCSEELPETHETLEENSHEKAQYIFTRYDMSCFADDTGLEVSALHGAPGVYSARYAGVDCNADNNMELLLKNLGNTADRSARFRTVITLITPEHIKQFEGVIEGSIATSRQGNGGFGYDPIFIPQGYTSTFATLTFAEKNTISHRALAVAKLATYLHKSL